MKTTVANVNIFLDSHKCNGYNAIVTVTKATVNNKKRKRGGIDEVRQKQNRHCNGS